MQREQARMLASQATELRLKGRVTLYLTLALTPTTYPYPYAHSHSFTPP